MLPYLRERRGSAVADVLRGDAPQLILTSGTQPRIQPHLDLSTRATRGEGK